MQQASKSDLKSCLSVHAGLRETGALAISALDPTLRLEAVWAIFKSMFIGVVEVIEVIRASCPTPYPVISYSTAANVYYDASCEMSLSCQDTC